MTLEEYIIELLSQSLLDPKERPAEYIEVARELLKAAQEKLERWVPRRFICCIDEIRLDKDLRSAMAGLGIDVDKLVYRQATNAIVKELAVPEPEAPVPLSPGRIPLSFDSLLHTTLPFGRGSIKYLRLNYTIHETR